MIDQLLKEAESLEFNRNGHLGMLIFEALPNLSGPDKQRLAERIAIMFPANSVIKNFQPFKQHLHTSFMRKIFGLSARNGTLLNITHSKRAEDYQLNCCRAKEWEPTFEFVELLEREFTKHKRYIGLILLHEGLGHRYGDLASLYTGDDNPYFAKMEEHYGMSTRLSKEIKVAKQLYVLWFWRGCYYFKNGNQKQAKRCFVKFHRAFEKRQSVARVVPVDKIKLSYKLLKKCWNAAEFRQYLATRTKSSGGKLNKVLRKIGG